MDASRVDKVRLVLFVETLQIRNMLEIVRVQFSALDYKIRLHIIFKYDNLQLPSFRRQYFARFFKDLSMRNGRSRHFDRTFFLCLRGCRRLAASLNDKGILKFNTVCIYKCSLIVRMEELLFPEPYDLFVEPVEKALISLGNRRSNGVRAAQGVDSYRVSFVFRRKCDNFSVIISPRDAGPVFKSTLCSRIGVKLLQLDLRVVLGQISLRRRSGDDNDLIVRSHLRKIRDHSVVVGDNAQCHIHVRQCEINFFRSLGRHCEVCQDDVDLSCLQIFNPAGRLGRYIFKFHAQVLCDPVAKIYIISLIFAVLIHIAEGALVGEYTDRDLSARLNLLQSSVSRAIFFRSFCLLRLWLIRALRRLRRSGTASGQQ